MLKMRTWHLCCLSDVLPGASPFSVYEWQYSVRRLCDSTGWHVVLGCYGELLYCLFTSNLDVCSSFQDNGHLKEWLRWWTACPWPVLSNHLLQPVTFFTISHWNSQLPFTAVTIRCRGTNSISCKWYGKFDLGGATGCRSQVLFYLVHFKAKNKNRISTGDAFQSYTLKTGLDGTSLSLRTRVIT